MAGLSSLGGESNAPDWDSSVGYVVSGILGALLWDIFSNLRADYDLIHRLPIGAPTIVYFLSRITILSCFATMVRFSTGVNIDCARLLCATHWTFAFGVSLTTLLFVFRVRALYKNQKRVASLFFILWLAVVAAAVVETQEGNIGVRQEFSGRCITVRNITPFIIATTFVPMANDIIIFFAVTWKLVQNSHEELSPRKKLATAVFGRRLPAFSKTLLRDGQAYFLTTVLVSIVTICIYCFAPRSVEGYSALLAFLNIGVMHLMACKIYRKTRLGAHTIEADSSLGPMEFRMNSSNVSSNLELGPMWTPKHCSHLVICRDKDDYPDLESHQGIRIDAGEEEVDVVDGRID